MVNMNPPAAPEMVEIDGQQYRPEDVPAAEARAEQKALVLLGVQDPNPIGVPATTDNRRKTDRELFVEAGGTDADPAATILARESASDVGVPVELDADPVTVATPSGTVTKPTRKRSSASDASE